MLRPNNEVSSRRFYACASPRAILLHDATSVPGSKLAQFDSAEA
jgi:hypothetical protein